MQEAVSSRLSSSCSHLAGIVHSHSDEYSSQLYDQECSSAKSKKWSCKPPKRYSFAVGLQAQQILLELQSALLQDDGLKDLQRAKVCQVLAEADKDWVDGSDEFLQLVQVASYTQRVRCGGAC